MAKLVSGGRNALVTPREIWNGGGQELVGADEILAHSGFTVIPGVYQCEWIMRNSNNSNSADRCQSRLYIPALTGKYYFGTVSDSRWSSDAGFVYWQHTTQDFRCIWWNTGSKSSGGNPRMTSVLYYGGV